MYGVKSRDGRWSVSLCSCSHDTAHVQYGNVIVHILREDLRDLGLALQSIADGADEPEQQELADFKKGLVQ
jgi:hypothetical protein